MTSPSPHFLRQHQLCTSASTIVNHHTNTVVEFDSTLAVTPRRSNGVQSSAHSPTELSHECSPGKRNSPLSDRTLIVFQTLTIHAPPVRQPQNNKPVKPGETKPTQKTQAEFDEELRQKLDAISGEGGEAGVEYENGQPVAMKRAVKENMFRVI